MGTAATGAAGAPLIHMAQLHKTYGIDTPTPVRALTGIDLDIADGEFLSIVGPSGCGKSTLLALAAGLDQVSAGDVRSDGCSLVTLTEAALASYRATRVGIVFQSENLWPSLTAVENVGLSLALAGTAEPTQRAELALAEMGLAQRAEHRASALSGGEQQRVAIAAALAKRAPLILADEPTGELDTANQQVVLSALRRLPAEHDCAVVVVTHSGAVASAADRVVELCDGRRVR